MLFGVGLPDSTQQPTAYQYHAKPGKPWPDYLLPKQRLALVPTLPKACLGCSPGPHLPKDRMEEVTCQLCAQKVDKKDAVCLNANKLKDDANKKAFYRCTKCNSFSSRIYRAKGRVEWASAEAKQEFFLQHNTLAGIQNWRTPPPRWRGTAPRTMMMNL